MIYTDNSKGLETFPVAIAVVVGTGQDRSYCRILV